MELEAERQLQRATAFWVEKTRAAAADKEAAGEGKQRLVREKVLREELIRAVEQACASMGLDCNFRYMCIEVRVLLDLCSPISLKVVVLLSSFV